MDESTIWEKIAQQQENSKRSLLYNLKVDPVLFQVNPCKSEPMQFQVNPCKSEPVQFQNKIARSPRAGFVFVVRNSHTITLRITPFST